mgnify:CR=1 FL=1
MIELFAGHHPALTAPARPGIVAGIGLRAQATVTDIASLLDACLGAAGLGRTDLVALATMQSKSAHPALAEMANRLALPVIAVPADLLHRPVPNPSPRVAALADVPSVAEAAALAFGPLLVPKQRSLAVTCALSRYTAMPGSGKPSAAMAASTLSTSSAGP